MRNIFEELKQTINVLLDVKVSMDLHEQMLDEHPDFSEVTKLYLLMNGAVKDLINDILIKLFPGEIPWGSQSIFKASQNVINEQNYPLFEQALQKYYVEKELGEDMARLKKLSERAQADYRKLSRE